MKAKRPRAFALWFTGLSCAGKTTLARAVCRRLARRGWPVRHLDGDAVRKSFSRGLGFGKKDRLKNARAVALRASALTRRGVTAVVSLITPYRQSRRQARRMVGRFVEVYVRCPLRVCEERDDKGLYRLARTNKIRQFTGISSPYEKPWKAEIVVRTDRQSVGRSVDKILKELERWLARNP